MIQVKKIMYYYNANSYTKHYDVKKKFMLRYCYIILIHMIDAYILYVKNISTFLN